MGGGSGSSTAVAGEIGSQIATAAAAYGGDGDPSVHHVLELGNMPDEAAALPDDQRYKLVRYVFVCTRFCWTPMGCDVGWMLAACVVCLNDPLERARLPGR
jgi:hypothetical protein